MSRKSTFSDAIASASPPVIATNATATGIASHSVARTRGSSAKLRTSSTASMTPKLIRFVATTESGTSCRGKRVLRMRFALSSSEREADCTDVAKKIHGARPTSRKRRSGPRSRTRLPQDGEDEQVDRHQQDRVRQGPGDAQHGAAVLRLDVPAEEVSEQLAVAD
jgi:hypothetical protein